MSDVFTCQYSFHGLALTVTGDDVVSACMRSRLGRFPRNNSDHDQVRFEFCFVPDREQHLVKRPVGAGRPVYEHAVGEFLYFDRQNQLYINCCDRVRVLCEPGPGRVQFSIDQSQSPSSIEQKSPHHFQASPIDEPGPLTPSLSPTAGERVSARTGEVFHGVKAPTIAQGNSLHDPLSSARGEGIRQQSAGYPAASVIWFVTHLLFTISLVEVLKQRGRYSLHAAALCSDGKALLIAGTSGAGKSTLALALLRAGFGFLGDDMVFLVPDPEGLRVLAFPEEIDVTAETAAMFPELHYLLSRPQTSGWPKYQACAEAVFGIMPTWECRPAVLVFPRITHAANSILKSMGRDEALLELAPNVLLTEARSSQAHLDVLSKLVEETACYRLETGRDFDEISMLMRDLMK